MDNVNLALCVGDVVVYGVGVGCEWSDELAELLLVRVEWCPTAFDQGRDCSGSAFRDGDGNLSGEVVHVEGGARAMCLAIAGV